MDGGSGGSTHTCGLSQVLIFIAALVSGTACSICSKTMMELHSVGITGEKEIFEKPIFQTFGMFIGMLFGLVMHCGVLFFRIPFPGYDAYHDSEQDEEKAANKHPSEKDALVVNQDSEESQEEKKKIPVWMYFLLAIPSLFELGATALAMMGLQYIDVSIYQLLRGAGIIFVALMKQHVLGDRLFHFQWIGVFWNVVSVLLVGSTAILASAESPKEDGHEGKALLGVVLVLGGAFVQACQFVFEEKVMTMDVSSPPLLLIGMEGLWGTILCLVVVYPMVYFLPGSDHGSYENPYNTYDMIKNSSTIQWAIVVYIISIFFYNLFAILVTYMLSSIWHAILDNFRPITVWGTGLFIFYAIAIEGFGEPWTKYSFIQLLGMFVLVYGTAVYNAPNDGSIKLEGHWWDFFLDFSNEYREIEMEEIAAWLRAHWRKSTF